MIKYFTALVLVALLLNLISPESVAVQAQGLPPGQQSIQVVNAIDLQAAINSVANNGVIELAAGTYSAPGGGFQIVDIGKSFTIRAISPGAAVLDGGGNNPVMHYLNGSASTQSILFEGLKFANGRATSDGFAGGISIEHGRATFINCTFENNKGQQPSAGGGAMFITQKSQVLIVDSTFTGNSAMNYGGAIALEFASSAYIHNSTFSNNRTNLPGHATWAAGGAIHVGNSLLRVSNSAFLANQAGYVGGAIYAIGEWNKSGSDVIVANSLFRDNKAQKDPSVTFDVPTEGGAFHAEDLTTAKIYNSRFITNSADTGGGVNLYRAIVEVNDSVFLGNQAVGAKSSNGFGGAMSAISNDTEPFDGGVNRRTANLTVRRTFIQGRYGAVGSAARVAAGIYITGDGCRAFGNCGIGAMDGTAANRANLTLEGVVFADLSTNDTGNNSAGGGVYSDLANVTISGGIFLKNEAVNSAARGGALMVVRSSSVSMTGTYFINNSAVSDGGAISVWCSDLNVDQSTFLLNTLAGQNSGTSIASWFCTPGRNGLTANMTGTVKNSAFSGQTTGTTTLIINDEDSFTSPYNDLRYTRNTFFVPSAGAKMYVDRFVSQALSVQGLNDLLVSRSGSSTDKGTGNIEMTGTPSLGSLLAVPSAVLQSGAAGESTPPVFLANGWSGSSAALDGSAESNHYGWPSTTTVGSHTLVVDRKSFAYNVPQAPLPAATFQTGSGGGSLQWGVEAGSYLDAMIDRDVSLPVYPAASGSTNVNTSGEIYRFYAITQQGGVVVTLDSNTPLLSAPASVFMLIGLNLPTRHVYIPIQNTGGNVMTWRASNGSPNLFQLLTPSGQTTGSSTIELNVLAASPGTFQGQITVDAGSAGSQVVAVTVLVVSKVLQIFLPEIMR